MTVSAWAVMALAGDDMHSQMGHGKMKEAHSGEEAPGHSHDQCQYHGGLVSMTKQHHFETVFSPDGIRIYRYSGSQVPMQVQKAEGAVTLKFKDETKKEIPFTPVMPDENETTVYFCPGHPEATQMEPGICEACGTMKLMTQDYLFAEADLSNVKPGSMKAVVHIKGMTGSEPEVLFTEAFEGFVSAVEGTPEHTSETSGDHDHGEHKGH
jgi:hypothetical protein